MKKECEIVQDLLFGYNDKTLQNESKELVEKHLTECNECKEILRQIEKDTLPKEEEKEINYFKKVRNNLNRKTIILTIASILLILIIIFNVLVFINYNNKASEMKIILKDNVTEEQLKDFEETIKSKIEDVEIKYSSKENELQKYKDKLGDKADKFLAGYDENNNPLRPVYYIKADINDVKKIEELITNIDYIININTYTTINPYELFIVNFINK